MKAPHISSAFCRCLMLIYVLYFADCLNGQSYRLMHNPPVNDFVISDLCYGSVSHFSNTTTSTTELTYTWTITESGNPVPVYISNLKDFSFQFPNKTTYTVELTAYNGHYSTIQRVIQMDSKLKAAFEFYGCQLHFINLSTCASSCFWDFGDGKTSGENSPFHDYAESGMYTTKLVVYKGAEKDSACSTFHYYANKLTGNFSHHIIGDTVYFRIADSLLVEENTDYYWSWGDGTVTNIWSYPGEKPKHVYPKIGKDSTYTVFLLERTACFDGFGQGKVTIKDNTPVSGTIIFPNPIDESGIIRIVTDRKKEMNDLSIRNLAGSLLKDFMVTVMSQGVNIHLSNLPPGVYLLEFRLGADVIRSRIIKK